MDRLKKIFVFFLLFSLLLQLPACQSSPSSGDLTSSSSSEKQDSKESSPATSMPETDSSSAAASPEAGAADSLYPTATAILDWESVSEDTLYQWNKDGTLTFQNKNELHTLSAENRLLETVTLPAEQLPQDTGYSLTWSDGLILALNSGWSEEPFSVVYFTDGGGVYLANMTLFDRQGNLVRQYPQSQVYGYDEAGQQVIYLPAPEGKTVIGYALPENGSHVYWLDDETAIFNCHSRVVLYDFSADEGKILDDMSALVDKHGKFGVYYGVEALQCGVMDGSFYYLAHRDEEKSNLSGTVWRADKNGAVQLFDGMEFYHLFVGNHALVAVSNTDQDESDQVYCANGHTLQLEKICEKGPSFPFIDDGRITFSSRFGQEESVLLSYDYENGRLFTHSLEDILQVNRLFTQMKNGSLCWYYTIFQNGTESDFVYDTAAGTTESLPEGALSQIRSVSPDGTSFVEYDASTHSLRVRQWTF